VINDNLFFVYTLATNSSPVSSANNGYSAYLTSPSQILPGAVGSVANLAGDFPLYNTSIPTNLFPSTLASLSRSPSGGSVPSSSRE